MDETTDKNLTTTASEDDQGREADKKKPEKSMNELEYEEISNESEGNNDEKVINEDEGNHDEEEEEEEETSNVGDNDDSGQNKNEELDNQNNEKEKTIEEVDNIKSDLEENVESNLGEVNIESNVGEENIENKSVEENVESNLGEEEINDNLEKEKSEKNDVNNDVKEDDDVKEGNDKENIESSPGSDNNSQEESEPQQKGTKKTADEESLSKNNRENSMPEIEEVDADVSVNKTSQEDEEDVLSDDRTQTTEKQKSPQESQMDVDNEELANNKTKTNEETRDETSKASDAQDVEMTDVSENNKSDQSKEKDKFDQLFENIRKSTEAEPMEIQQIECDKDNESQDYDKDESGRDPSVENRDETDTTNQVESVENPENEITENQTENVQEEAQGESADVCLIPDNDEELTGAEKEQAILARQNAEKEDAEKEAENETTESTIDQEKEIQEQEDSQITDDFVVEPDVVVEIDERVELPLPTKTLIVSIIHTDQKCVECSQQKSCEFRFKDDESGLYLYVCSNECCDALINKEKTRFFVRKRKYIVEDLSEPKTGSCVVCKNEKLCKYTFKQDDDTIYICNDDCYNLLSKEESDKLKLKRNSIRVKNLSSAVIQDGTTKSSTSDPKIIARSAHEADLARLDRDASFERHCANCCISIRISLESLIWETLDFCSQLCLSKYQYSIGEKCRTCMRPVSQASLGKYCVRFGFEICQFCCAACLDKYKKSLKNCSYCQKDISEINEGFLAPVGDNEQFKDFCSQNCMKKYDAAMNPKRKTKIEQCSVCNNKKVVQVELILDERGISFCSSPCFSAFKFVNNIMPDKCNLCSKYFERKSTEHFTIYDDNIAQIFCGKICMNMFITQNRKIVFCQWCKVKKYNFDMIEKRTNTNEKVTFCSLNCLVFYGVSLNRIAKQKVKCDYCLSEKSPQYHLTMSDSTMRNFCTYQCVMQFQSRFSSTPLTLDNTSCRQNEIDQLPEDTSGSLPFPTGLPKRIKSNLTSVQSLQIPLEPTQSTMPIIANITSLAPESTLRKRSRARSKNTIETTYPQMSQNVSQHRAHGAQMHQSKTSTVYTAPKIKISKKTTGTSSKEPANKTFVVELRSDPKLKFNMNTQCMPITETIGITCKPQSRDSEIQTDSDLKSKKLIPIPVPIFIPQPIQGFPMPRPIPIPFAFPIPVPIFIPTTKNSAQGIMKEIKKLQDKMPADPYEAELLMMAELVASDKKKEEESDEENNDVGYNNDNSYGEDVLQMALKMATEYDEPPSVDLSSTINNDSSSLMYNQMQMNQRSGRGKKRITPTDNIPRENDVQPIIKKRRPSDNPVVTPNQILAVEKPDVNMCLKYTFGVNAWKQWVMTKNVEIEKSSIRRKPFKSELLQMTADELSFSLCLFVKEVRKPNGTEYAPDTIYYLVLGIQQYLYENGRIDNIFTDPYYERFTDCLDEVARKFSILYNDSQYIVTRVEEEHLWECKQLGAHSPHVLLSTLMFFNTKHFNLTTVEEHMQLSFSHIMKHWKRNSQGAKQPGSRNVLLRFYPPNTGQADSKKKKVYEQQENEANPLRCPVRLYEFYLSKCPESVKTRNDVFYLQPERSCVPDSPVWYSTQPLSQENLQKMLHRVKMVKEINVALLTI